jgi:Chalcone isomerase-like
MKKSISLLSLAFMLVVTSVVGQTTIYGVTLPAKLGKDKKLLDLNGAGVRNKYFMNVYVLGLYLTTKTSNASTIINADEPMAVRLRIISNLVTKEKMADAMRDGFNLSLGNQVSKHQKEIDACVNIFKSDEIKIGDTFDIYYTPGKGMSATKNGKVLNMNIPGLAFKKAVFGIWLGVEPVDDALKDGILGL